MVTPEEALRLLVHGCAQVISERELLGKLEENRPLRVKLGVDPTAPDIHLGHSVGLTKLRQFQDLGHDAILIIGDFTAMIGDPSGRSATRPQLTHEEVMANATTYKDQALKILDIARTRIVFNGQWFEAMSFDEVIKLNSRVTLQQMLQREDFRERLEKGRPIRAHEIQYPIMQAWDSVMIRADVEIGGTDQLFNIMVGRDLQREEGQPQQIAMLLQILEGTDGVQKMSKSLGNAISLSEPPGEMFGKIMSIPDEVMPRFYDLLLLESVPDHMHPMAAKKALAKRIVARFHSEAEAHRAVEDFEQRFSQRNLESADLPVYTPAAGKLGIVDIVVDAYAKCFNVARSRSEARRLIEQGSVQWRGEKIINPKAEVGAGTSGVLKLDKIRAIRIAEPIQAAKSGTTRLPAEP